MRKSAYEPEDILFDPDLSLKTKSIYFILVAKAQGRTTVQFSRDELFREIGTTDRGYYPNFQPLLDKGYVQRLPQPNFQNKFHPTVLRIPRETDIPLWKESVMSEPGIPLKAKGLYAYFCLMLTGYNDEPIWHQRIIEDLGISPSMYIRLRNSLFAAGAITGIRGHQSDRIMPTAPYVHHISV